MLKVLSAPLSNKKKLLNWKQEVSFFLTTLAFEFAASCSHVYSVFIIFVNMFSTKQKSEVRTCDFIMSFFFFKSKWQYVVLEKKFKLR